MTDYMDLARNTTPEERAKIIKSLNDPGFSLRLLRQITELEQKLKACEELAEQEHRRAEALNERVTRLTLKVAQLQGIPIVENP